MSTSTSELLALAREARGLTQGELAHRSGLSQASVSRLESGLAELDGAALSKISSALGVPPSFFVALSRVRVGGLCLRYRRRKTMSVRLLKKIEARTALLAARIWKLMRGVELEAENEFHVFDLEPDGDVDTPESAAQRLRASWGMPLGPVHSVVRSIEDAGGIIVMCDFESSKVDAISQWRLPEAPLIFVNADLSGDRLRWTLAHEIGHLVLHHTPGRDEEDEANRFASEFIMPAREIQPDLTGVTMAQLGALKIQWKSSMAALARRARDLGCMSEKYYRSVNIEFSRRGWRRSEPIAIPAERPTILATVLDHYLSELGYTNEELCEVLAISPDDFARDFGVSGAPGVLRVV